MYRVLIVLFCIIFVNDINGVWLKQPISIDEDAIELTELIEKFSSLKPDRLKRTKPLVFCRIIDECCDDEDRLEAISFIGQVIHDTHEYHFAEIMLTCLNSAILNESNKLCLPIVNSIISMQIASKYFDVKRYFDIINKYDQELNKFVNYILSTCNNEEIHAYFCLSNKKLIETCVGRVLKRIYNDDYNTYEEILINTKQVLIDLNQQLSRTFIKNINVE